MTEIRINKPFRLLNSIASSPLPPFLRACSFFLLSSRYLQERGQIFTHVQFVFVTLKQPFPSLPHPPALSESLHNASVSLHIHPLQVLLQTLPLSPSEHWTLSQFWASTLIRCSSRVLLSTVSYALFPGRFCSGILNYNHVLV